MSFVPIPSSRTVGDLFKEWKKHKLLTASTGKTSAPHSQKSMSSRKYLKKIASTIQKDEVEKWLYGLDIAEKDTAALPAARHLVLQMVRN